MIAQAKPQQGLKADIKVTVVTIDNFDRAILDTDTSRPLAFIFSMWAWGQLVLKTKVEPHEFIAADVESKFNSHTMTPKERVIAKRFYDAGTPVFIATKDRNLANCIADILTSEPAAQIIRVVSESEMV